MHLLRFHQGEPLQGGSKGINISFRSVERLKHLWERLPKGTVLRVQANVFPPTMMKTLINLLLEVVTLTGEGGEQSKCVIQENHEPHVSLFNLSYSLKEDIPPRNQNSCRFHEPYPFGMPNRGRPGGPYYPIIN